MQSYNFSFTVFIILPTKHKKESILYLNFHRTWYKTPYIRSCWRVLRVFNVYIVTWFCPWILKSICNYTYRMCNVAYKYNVAAHHSTSIHPSLFPFTTSDCIYVSFVCLRTSCYFRATGCTDTSSVLSLMLWCCTLNTTPTTQQHTTHYSEYWRC